MSSKQRLSKLPVAEKSTISKPLQAGTSPFEEGKYRPGAQQVGPLPVSQVHDGLLLKFSVLLSCALEDKLHRITLFDALACCRMLSKSMSAALALKVFPWLSIVNTIRGSVRKAVT